MQKFYHHDLRHTVARYLNHVQDVSMKGVQPVLRHKRQSTTEIYVQGNYRGTEDTTKLLSLEALKK